MIPSHVRLNYNGTPFVESDAVDITADTSLTPYINAIQNCSLVQLVSVGKDYDDNGTPVPVPEYTATIFPPNNPQDPSSANILRVATGGQVKVRAYIGRGGFVDLVLTEV